VRKRETARLRSGASADRRKQVLSHFRWRRAAESPRRSLRHGFWRDAENGNRDIALPSKVPAVRPMAVWGGQTTKDAESKLVLTLALILAFSPGEKESPWRVLISWMTVRPIQSRVFQKAGARFSFSLGRRPG